MKREGKTLKTLPDGHPRRLADGRNAVRKMNAAQLSDFLDWMCSADAPDCLGEVCSALEKVSMYALGEEDLATLGTSVAAVLALTGREQDWPRCEQCGQFATECQADDNPPHPFTLAAQ